MFQISIEVPEHVELESRPRPFFVKFKTQEEKDNYVAEEFRATRNELKALAAAWSKNERMQAFIHLYHARKAFHDYTKHKETPKELA